MWRKEYTDTKTDMRIYRIYSAVIIKILRAMSLSAIEF